MIKAKKIFKVLESVIIRNKGVISIFILALLVAFAFLVSMNLPEWFKGAHNWFEFAYNISLSIIAGFIFFCYQVIIPNYKKNEIRETLMKYEFEIFYEYLDTFYRDLTVLTNYYEGYQLDTSNFIEKFPNGFSDLYDLNDGNTDEFIIRGLHSQVNRKRNTNYIKSIDNLINTLKSEYIDYLDANVIKKLLKIKNETHIISSVLNMFLCNNVTDENNLELIRSIKKMYERLRDLQANMGIEPQYATSTFKEIDF